MNMYTKVTAGSKQVAAVVKNLMAIPKTITKWIKGAQVVATNVVSQVKLTPGTLERLVKIHGSQLTRISDEQRKETLVQQMDLSGLERWSEGSQSAGQTLLAEYHDIFPLNHKSWVVWTWQSIRSRSLMMNPSKRSSEGSPSNGG